MSDLRTLVVEALRAAGDTRCVNPDCAESHVEMSEAAYTKLVARLHDIRDLLASHDQPEPDGWITEAMLKRLRERGWTEGRIWQEPRHDGYVPFVIQPTE